LENPYITPKKVTIPKFMKYDNVPKSRNFRNETTSRKVQSQNIGNKTISGKIINQNEHVKITCISKKKHFRNLMKLLTCQLLHIISMYYKIKIFDALFRVFQFRHIFFSGLCMSTKKYIIVQISYLILNKTVKM